MASLYVPREHCVPDSVARRSIEHAAANERRAVDIPSNITARYVPMSPRSAAPATGWRASIARRKLELVEALAGLRRFPTRSK